MPIFHEDDLSWVDWEVEGYTGIELWNGMSEIKSVSKNALSALFYGFFPQYMPHGPLTRTLRLWDGLLASGKRIAVVGGSDAHAIPFNLGPLHRIIYPYEFHFRCVNTHLITPETLSGDLPADRSMILEALRQGHAFVGYDLPATTRGFRFTAHGQDGDASMGDELPLLRGATLEIRLPQKAECRLIWNGQVIKTWQDRENCAFNATQPGSYRVEVYIHFLGSRRGWIFSNPIYLRGKTIYAG